MKKYDSYKDSFLAWLGIYPSHWGLLRAKDLTYNIGDGLHGTPSYDELGHCYFVNGNNLSNGKIDFKDASKINDDEYKKIAIQLNENTILYSINGTIGNIAYYQNENIALGKSIAYFKLKNIQREFVFYLLQSNAIFNFYKFEQTGTTINNLSLNTLRHTFFLIPSNIEQTKIAQYLDTKTQTIDKKVNLLEKKIVYYKELRKSAINEIVTKGLYKNVESQENDLGFSTPITWPKKRLKDIGYLYSGLSGKSGDDFNQDDNENNKGFIPFTNIANNTYLKKDHLGTVVVYEGEKQNKVREGDVFFLMSSEGYGDIGKSAVLAENIEDTYLNSFCKGFRVKRNSCNPYFLNYLLLSDYYRQLLIIEGKGFTRINLKMEKINDFEVYLPDTISEQVEIVKYLDDKTQTIDKIVSNIQSQISTLKELRKTLINDVVTGKIKVVE